MSARKNDEQRALDIVAGRGDAADTSTGVKGGPGMLELTGIALWLLVLAGGGLVAVYYFVLAPK